MSELFEILGRALDPNGGQKVQQTFRQRRDAILYELGERLCSDDLDVSNNAVETLFKAAIEFLDDVEHPTECPRNRDDFDCTCSIGTLAQEMQDWIGAKMANHWPPQFERVP